MSANRNRFFALKVSLAFLSIAGSGLAGEADVLKADMQAAPDGRYTITVTLLHADEGWDHYADRWEVLGPDGEMIATRRLAHPHVNEQPFTRSLSGVEIPEGVERVTIRAHDGRHGYGGKTLELDVPPRG